MDWGEGGVIFESGEEVKKPYGNCCLKIPGMISIYDPYCHLAIMSGKYYVNCYETEVIDRKWNIQ